jgi:hypothetical protein
MGGDTRRVSTRKRCVQKKKSLHSLPQHKLHYLNLWRGTN